MRLRVLFKNLNDLIYKLLRFFIFSVLGKIRALYRIDCKNLRDFSKVIKSSTLIFHT